MYHLAQQIVVQQRNQGQMEICSNLEEHLHFESVFVLIL
jgi:hypothetical protein